MSAALDFDFDFERGGRVSDAMRAFRTFLGHSDMVAYLAHWLFETKTVEIEFLRQ